MNYYIGLIEKEDTSLYGIWFPDLLGCTSAAPTIDELIRQAPLAVKLYCDDMVMDGEELPIPRSLQQLHHDNKVIGAINEGAMSHLVVYKQQKQRILELV